MKLGWFGGSVALVVLGVAAACGGTSARQVFDDTTRDSSVAVEDAATTPTQETGSLFQDAAPHAEGQLVRAGLHAGG